MSWLFKDTVVIMKEIMSWLFKDPTNSGLAKINHAKSTSKKSSKGFLKSSEFFSQKTTNKTLMYLLASFIP